VIDGDIVEMMHNLDCIETLTMILEPSTHGLVVHGQLVVRVTNNGIAEGHRDHASQLETHPIRPVVPITVQARPPATSSATTLHTARSMSSIRLTAPSRQLPPLPSSHQADTSLVTGTSQPSQVRH
jgi:hypothetical protein